MDEDDDVHPSEDSAGAFSGNGPPERACGAIAEPAKSASVTLLQWSDLLFATETALDSSCLSIGLRDVAWEHGYEPFKVIARELSFERASDLFVVRLKAKQGIFQRLKIFEVVWSQDFSL